VVSAEHDDSDERSERSGSDERRAGLYSHGRSGRISRFGPEIHEVDNGDHGSESETRRSGRTGTDREPSGEHESETRRGAQAEGDRPVTFVAVELLDLSGGGDGRPRENRAEKDER